MNILSDILRSTLRSQAASRLAKSPAGSWLLCICSMFMLFMSGLYITSYYSSSSLPTNMLVGIIMLAVALLMMRGNARVQRIMLILTAAALLGGLATGYFVNAGLYNDAIHRFENGEYEQAQGCFETLDDFRDSEERAAECESCIQYEKALAALEDSPETAYQRMFALKGYAPADAMLATPEFQAAREQRLSVGRTVTFGRYVQETDSSYFVTEAEPIHWRILARDGDRALLVSYYALDKRALHNTKHPVTWADSALRQWLNNDFLSAAFTAEEQALIVLTPVDSLCGDTAITQDRLFLLSYDELCQYMPVDSYRIAKSTPRVTGRYDCYFDCEWLLRPTGEAASSAPCINRYGVLTTIDAAFDPAGVRPFLWVTLDPDFF